MLTWPDGAKDGGYSRLQVSIPFTLMEGSTVNSRSAVFQFAAPGGSGLDGITHAEMIA